MDDPPVSPILVLGAHGSVGSAVVRAAGRLGIPVAGLGRSRSAGLTADLGSEMSSEFLRDLRGVSPHLVINALRHDVDASSRQRQKTLENVARVVEHVEAHLVHVGSVAEVGAHGPEPVPEKAALNPVTPYGESKVFERAFFVQKFGLDYLHLRLFNVFGQRATGNSFFNDVFLQVLQGAESKQETIVKVSVDSSEIARDVLHIDLAGEIIARCALEGMGRDVLNVCSGRATGLLEFANAAGRRCNIDVDVVSRGKSVEIPCLRGSVEKLHQVLPDMSLRSSLEDSISLCEFPVS